MGKNKGLSHKDVRLSAEDNARMTRLSEEVKGRLEEMALIVARNLGIKIGEVQFTPHAPEGKGPVADEAPITKVKVVCTPDGEICGCWDEHTKTCHVC